MPYTGWIILLQRSSRVYDYNICGIKIAEKLNYQLLLLLMAFTSHQKKAQIIADDKDVHDFIGELKLEYHTLDKENPIIVGCYMNEPDLLNNKYQLHLAMEEARNVIAEVFREYGELTGRSYNMVEGYKMEDAEAALFILGSSYDTARMAVDKLREEGKKVGVFTSSVLRPFPKRELYEICKNVKSIIVADRQDSYGAGGGNMTLELKAALQDYKANIEVASLVYGLSGRDFYIEDGIEMLNRAYETAQKEK